MPPTSATTGLGGKLYDLTDPAGCEALREEALAATSDQERDEIVTGTQGRLCISGGESTLTGDSAGATLREYTTEAAWALQRGDGGWEITESEVVSP